MIGIYIIKNKVNDKIYVGQAINIEKRWEEHRRAKDYKNQHAYNYPLYKAMRKYGFENFEFYIVDLCAIDKLIEREQYWIEFYNSKVPNGYNQEDAINPKRGEKCNFAKLTDVEALEVINLLKTTSLTMKEIGEIYNVSGSCIEDINKGKNRVQDGETYPIRKETRSISHRGSRNNFTNLNEEAVMEIRKRYVNESMPEILKDFEHLVGFSGLKKICYGVTWKHLPVYKKREKKWITYHN